LTERTCLFEGLAREKGHAHVLIKWQTKAKMFRQDN